MLGTFLIISLMFFGGLLAFALLCEFLEKIFNNLD